MANIRVGDVFYDSWGYDQTNIDFVEVVAVSPSGKSVLCQMVGKRDAEGDHVVPSEKYGVKFRLLVRGNGLVGSYPFVQGTYPKCRKPESESGAFNCLRLRYEDTDKIRFWSGISKRNLCEGCMNFVDEPQISFREGGSFVKFEHPVYETPLGMGH